LKGKILFHVEDSINTTRNNSQVTFHSVGNKGNAIKALFYCILMNSTEAHHLNQIAQIDTPHPNCVKTISLIFIIESMFPEIMQVFFHTVKNQAKFNKNHFF